MSVGGEGEHGWHMESGTTNGKIAHPVWQAPRIQTLSLAETRNGGVATTDTSTNRNPS